MAAAAGIRAPRSQAPFLLSLVALAAGVTGLLSAVLPTWPARFEVVREALTPAGPSVADGLLVSASFGLILLSRGLARRRHRAWQASVALLVVAAALHLAKGLEFDAALFDLCVLVLLLVRRKEFDAIGDPEGPPRAGRVALGALAALFAYGLAAIYVHAAIRGGAPSPREAVEQIASGLVGEDLSAHPGRFAHGLTLSLAASAIVCAAYVLWLALRPRDGSPAQEGRDRRDARRVLEHSACDSLSYFALRRDKAYFFNRHRTAFLAYRAVGGVALVSGDPIGPPEELDELLHDFCVFCHAHAWRVAAMGVAHGRLEAWQRVGLRSVYVGDEAVVRPSGFSLEGRPIRKVRQSVSRLHKAGYGVRIVRARELTPLEWAGVDRVSHAWLRGQPERGFSMALDDMHAPEHGEAVVTLALDARGAVAGFLHFVPVPGTSDLSLSAMRRLPQTPNGLMEFLLAETFAWGREHGVERVSLNFNAFGELLRGERLTRWQRLLRYGLGKADRYFQVERLLDFNRKFFPEWEPRYAAFERYGDVPLSALVSLSVESLVIWPRPLQRLWPRAA